jgi:transcriptional regulator GlxA family with amidase domain
MLEKGMNRETTYVLKAGEQIDAEDARMPPRKSRQGVLPPYLVTRVQMFVAENLACPLRIGDIARSVQLSPFHFARAFRSATGETPHAFVTRMRMEQAQRLLRHGTQPLREIAFSVGYHTQAHFSGVFRTHAGMTPGEFRRKWKEASEDGATTGSPVPTASARRNVP